MGNYTVVKISGYITNPELVMVVFYTVFIRFNILK